MHIPYEAQVLLVARGLAYRLAPLFNQFEDSVLHSRSVHRWPLRESPDQFVEEFLGTDLQVERVAAILDADVQELGNISHKSTEQRGGSHVEGEQGHILVSVVDKVYDCYRRFSGTVPRQSMLFYAGGRSRGRTHCPSSG
jgi:hypothetical protein